MQHIIDYVFRRATTNPRLITGVADDTAVSDQDVLSDISAMPDMTVTADDRRSQDHSSVLDQGVVTDDHVRVNVRITDTGEGTRVAEGMAFKIRL